MKKEQVFKIIALVLNLFVFISGQIILWRMLIIGTASPMDGKILHFDCLEYFTTLSNVWASLVAAVLVVFAIINFKRMDIHYLVG